MPSSPSTVIVSALSILLAACTTTACTDRGGSTPQERARPPVGAASSAATSSPLSEPELPERAADLFGERLEETIDRTTGDEEIDFHYVLSVEDFPSLMVSGTYRADPAAWVGVATVRDPTDPDAEYTVNVQSDHGHIWMQMEQWPKALNGCWLSLPRTQVPLGWQAMHGRTPGYITFLDGLVAAEDAVDAQLGRDRLWAHVPEALNLLPSQLIQQLELERPALHRALLPVRVELAYGRIDRVRISGAAIARRLELDPASEGTRTLRLVTVELSWDSTGRLEIRRPLPETVFRTKSRHSCAANGRVPLGSDT